MSDPTLIQEHSVCLNGGLGGGTTLLVTMSSTAAGNLLVAFVSWGSQFTNFGVSDAYTFPAGWTRLDHTPTGSTHYEEMWYYWNNPGGITTISVTGPKPGAVNNAVEFMWVGEYNNIESTSDPLEHHASTTGSSGAPSVATSVADAAVGDLVIACFGWNKTGSNTTFTHGTGYTDLTITQSNNIIQDQLFGEYKVSTAATTQTADGTIGATQAWGGIIATFVKNTTSVTQTAVVKLESDIAVTQSKVEPLEARAEVTQSKAEPLEAQHRVSQTNAGLLEAQQRVSQSAAISIESSSISLAATAAVPIEARGPITTTAVTALESGVAPLQTAIVNLESRGGVSSAALPIAAEHRVVQTAAVCVESFRQIPAPAQAILKIESLIRPPATRVLRLEARAVVSATQGLNLEAGGHQVAQTAISRIEAQIRATKAAVARLEARGDVFGSGAANLESWRGIGGPQTALVNIETIPGLHLAFIQIESGLPPVSQSVDIPLEMRGVEFNVHQSRAIPLEISGRRVHSQSPFPRFRFESTRPVLQTVLGNVESTTQTGVTQQGSIPISSFEDPNARAVLHIESRPHDIAPVQVVLSLETTKLTEGRLYLPIELWRYLPIPARLILEASGILQATRQLRVESRLQVRQTAAVALEQAHTRVVQQITVFFEARGFAASGGRIINLETEPAPVILPPGAEGVLVIVRAADGDLIVHEALPLSES